MSTHDTLASWRTWLSQMWRGVVSHVFELLAMSALLIILIT